MRNIDKKPNENSIGDAKRIRPPYIVASQLKNLIPVGIDTKNVATAKNRSGMRPIPTQNIWCAHTLKLMNAIPIVAAAINS